MSSPAQTTQTEVAKAPKTRQPSLPDKYGKFIQFAYYMMENVLGAEFQMDKTAYLEKIKLFGAVEEQQVLVQGFLNNAKENKKTIKKVLSDRKKEIAKANKPPRQSRAKKITTEDGEAPKRQPRKKANKEVNNVQEELLNELVHLARSDKPVAEAPAVVEPEPVAAPAEAAAEPAEKKPKAASKKTVSKKPKTETSA